MLSLFSFSQIMLRYTLLQILNSVPHSALDFCFTSTSSLHSHSQPQSLDEAIDSFTRMLFMCRPPSILQFLKILGSLAKTNHCPTAISLFQQLQSRVIAPNLFTLNILIKCSCGMVWITLAVSAFVKIFKSDFQPYTVTLTTIKASANSNLFLSFKAKLSKVSWTFLCFFSFGDAKKMEKKIEIVEYRERLDNTLASPHMTNYHMLKNLVQTQLLHSSKQLGTKSIP
ncbi:hypothetical protein Ahy_B07g086435 [Arachis hypogaea]|uniref:Pentatricopeptide repeat-containing protein n=1 Tax=Arachis hypogaea TaxID=3818 RepID=A0A444YA09_ARAHY|nr:hypothetical protein Ahy_B07g086435 [Arachis hypogaea]